MSTSSPQVPAPGHDQPQAGKGVLEPRDEVSHVLHGARPLELHLLDGVEDEQERCGIRTRDPFDRGSDRADQPVDRHLVDRPLIVERHRVPIELEDLRRQVDVRARRDRLQARELAAGLGVGGMEQTELANDLLDQPLGVPRVVASLVEVHVGERDRLLRDALLELEEHLAEETRLARAARPEDHHRRAVSAASYVTIDSRQLVDPSAEVRADELAEGIDQRPALLYCVDLRPPHREREAQGLDPARNGVEDREVVGLEGRQAPERLADDEPPDPVAVCVVERRVGVDGLAQCVLRHQLLKRP